MPFPTDSRRTKCEVTDICAEENCNPRSAATRLRPILFAGRYHRAGSIVSIRTTGSPYSDLNLLTTLVAGLPPHQGPELRWSVISVLLEDDRQEASRITVPRSDNPPLPTLDSRAVTRRLLAGEHHRLPSKPGQIARELCALMAAMLLSGDTERRYTVPFWADCSYLLAYDSLFPAPCPPIVLPLSQLQLQSRRRDQPQRPVPFPKEESSSAETRYCVSSHRY